MIFYIDYKNIINKNCTRNYFTNLDYLIFRVCDFVLYFYLFIFLFLEENIQSISRRHNKYICDRERNK
jgi:hypothetical protein